tara:strand:+ start:84 stop:206 length:123 start_codon:yes stop_codon:yes gene_type:complete
MLFSIIILNTIAQRESPTLFQLGIDGAKTGLYILPLEKPQ